MDIELKSKVFLVAAASKGLGFGIAEALAMEGARVSLGSRTKAEIESAASRLFEMHGCDARGYVLDATDPRSINEWVVSSVKDFGRIDGLVVNAGGPPAGNFESFSDIEWEKAFHLTLMSAVRMIRAVLPEMKKQGSGSILTVTSSSVKEPIDNLMLSNVFRAGVVSLVKSLSNDLAGSGIRVNNIVPGRINTDRVQALDRGAAKKLEVSELDHVTEQQRAIPLGRYGTIEEFGAAAAFLLSNKASYITGTTLVVDGGKMRGVS